MRVRPPELTTIEHYPALQNEWLVGVDTDEDREKGYFKSDFDLGLYDPLNINRSEIERHVRSFFGEKLMKPRLEKLWIGREGSLDPNYVEMMRKSVAYWRTRGDERAATRFEKELEGAQNIVNLVVLSVQNGEPLPIVMNASDPGDFYVDEEGNKKSVTFVWMLDQAEEDGWQYDVISLPTRFIGLENHWGLLKEIGNLQKTKELLQTSLITLSAENLIAYPVLLDDLVYSVEEIAKRLGFESWDEIERIVADQLALDKDPHARERRETLVDEFTNLIIIAVEQNKSTEYKEALVDAMSDMFALEAGSRDYLGLSSDEIRVEIEKTIRLALAEKLRVFDRSFGYYRNYRLELGDLRELYVQRTWMINAFRTNPLAQEARATGCGGSGMSFSQGYGMDRFSFGYVGNTYAGFEMIQNLGYQDTMTEISSFSTHSSTGKYKEYYDYYPDRCRGPCKSDKPYVAHPKSSEIGCGYFCSDCEE